MMQRKTIFTSGLVWSWIAIIVIAIDHYAKQWVMQSLNLGEPLSIMPFFNLTLAFNKGAAFSFLHDASGWQNIFLGGLAIVATIGILYWLWQLAANAVWTNIALCLILGGALGNAWDRMTYGYVIDYVDFYVGAWHFAIFNIADSAISVGAFMLIISWFWRPQVATIRK